MKKATRDDALLLYAELDDAEKRSVQRRVQKGELAPIVTGMVSSRPPEDWPALIARERIRVLAALFPGAVIGYRSAFVGGMPVDDTLFLNYGYRRQVALPGLNVALVKGAGQTAGDMPMMGRPLYFPSEARLLLENLQQSRGTPRRTAGREEVEARLLNICDVRGEEPLGRLREQARTLAEPLGLQKEFTLFDAMVGSILGTRASQLTTPAGKARTAAVPYDSDRIALLERLAAYLRATPLRQPEDPVGSPQARQHFAFLESYFSNFIEGTEFDVLDAKGFVLDGKPIEERPKDSHDILGVFRQALEPGWAHQTLAFGEPVLAQLCERHADQMKARPEVGPGQFKMKANRAGNTEFVAPQRVRGTLIEGSHLLPTVPAGTARALLAMFLVSEVHPFSDGNGRLARLAMNAELSVVKSCRIIVPTLYRETYLDCLRVLTRDHDPEPFVRAMQAIHEWSAAFDYEDLQQVLEQMRRCNAFERSLVQYQLLKPQELPQVPAAAPAAS